MTRVTDLQFTGIEAGSSHQFIIVDNRVTKRLRYSDLFDLLRVSITGADQNLATTSSVRFANITLNTGTLLCKNLFVLESALIGGERAPLTGLDNHLTTLFVTNGLRNPNSRKNTYLSIRGYGDKYVNTVTNWPIIAGERANRILDDPLPTLGGEKLLTLGVGGFSGRFWTIEKTNSFSGQLTFRAAENFTDNPQEVLAGGVEFYLGTNPIKTKMRGDDYTHLHLKQSWEMEGETPTPLLLFGSGINGQKFVVRDTSLVLNHEGVSKIKFLNTKFSIDGVPSEDVVSVDNPTLSGSNNLTFISSRRSASDLRKNPLRKDDSIGNILFRGQYLTSATLYQSGTSTGGISYYALENFSTGTNGSRAVITTANTGSSTITTRLDLQDTVNVYQSAKHIFKDNSGTTIAVLTTSSATFYSATVIMPGSSGGGSSAGLSSRTSVVTSTALLSVGSTASVSIQGFKTYVLSKIQTNVAAWVRIYATSVGQSTDVTRPQFQDPPVSRNVLVEVVTTSGSLTTRLTPALIGFNDQPTVDDQIFVNVTNQHSAASTVTVTLTVLQLET